MVIKIRESVKMARPPAEKEMYKSEKFQKSQQLPRDERYARSAGKKKK